MTTKQPMVRIQTIKPVSIVITDAGGARENVPEGEKVSVREDVARDLVQSGLAFYLEKRPAQESA